MEPNEALKGLGALSHAGRLEAFRLLVQAGEEGLAAGEVARRLNAPANTASTNLKLLAQAGLVRHRRSGRSIIYTADYARMAALLSFLVEDCCGGALAVCKPLVATVARVSCR